ncbi:hypothetical protein OESDEN_05596 [Oesophagostomum dentatum]|uniref:Exportin-1/Importin-beta-like domain-containing protein n=1 Tax=Oesophagostomum dentatum TaxID=61180 RepID=A0A0B1TEB8_OESDE|nr:hypothetical protein OESDEN_05596 [Oesophagostomum dentatum]
MAEPLDLSLAYQNISVFYSGVNNEEAVAWINGVQSSVQAWTLCDRILCERRDPLACCFAAQTLRQKIMKSLSELPKESYLSLRESLITHLSHIDVSAHDQVADATATQLCLAVADLYIQVPEWKNWVAELLNKFSALEGDRTRMLLTLLRVFPEEIQYSRVGENRRNEIRSELAESAASVFSYLTQVLEGYSNDQDMIKKVLLCLSSHLQNPALSTDYLASSPLLNTVFQVVAAPNAPSSLHDAATECVVSALIRAEDYQTHQALAMNLQTAVYQLHGPFNQAVAMEDMDKLQNFARIFVELAESFMEKLVNDGSDDPNSLGSIHTLELLLLLAGHHDYSLIEMTFNIWYRLSEGLFSFEDDQHIEKFKPYVQRYLAALYRHCRYDTEEEGIPDRDGDFADFRLKVVETVRDVVFIIGTESCVTSVGVFAYAETYAEFHSFKFSDAQEENNVIPELVQALVTLPLNSHPALLLTSIDLLGSASEWLSKNTSYLGKVVEWLLQLAVTPAFAAQAADAIEKISVRSSAELTHLIPLLVQLIPHLEASQSHGKKMETAISSCLKACTMLVMNLPADEIRARLVELCQPIIERLQMVGFIERNVNGANSTDAAPWLDIATELYKVLSEALKRYESTTRHQLLYVSRFIVRSLGVQSIGFVEPLITQMMDIFSRQHHSCFLYLSSILVDEYGGMESLQPGLMIMLETLAHGTFTVLTMENGPRDHPDTVDDLFRLAQRFVTRAPSVFFVHPVASALFECGMVCLSLDHQEANRSVTRFFTSIIEQLLSARKAGFRDQGVVAAEELVIVHGAKLIELCLHAAIFKVTGSLRRDLAEIVYMLSKIDRGKHKEWLIAGTSHLPRGPLAATDEQLEQFVDNITADPERVSMRDVYTQIRDLIKLYE